MTRFIGTKHGDSAIADPRREAARGGGREHTQSAERRSGRAAPVHRRSRSIRLEQRLYLIHI